MGLQTQYATAFLLCSAGAIMGALHDVYRTSLREWRFLTPFGWLFDLGFWAFSLVFVFTGLLGVNDGEVRLMTFVLLTIGFTVYYYVAHPLVVASTQVIVRLVYRLLRFCWRVFLVVFVSPVVWVWTFAVACVRVVDRTLLWVEPAIVWPAWQSLRLSLRLSRKIVRPVSAHMQEIAHPLSKKVRTHARKVLAWLRGE